MSLSPLWIELHVDVFIRIVWGFEQHVVVLAEGGAKMCGDNVRVQALLTDVVRAEIYCTAYVVQRATLVLAVVGGGHDQFGQLEQLSDLERGEQDLEELWPCSIEPDAGFE